MALTMELVMAAGDEFGLSLEIDAMKVWPTVDAAVRFLSEQRA